jgi:hypothetical protein
MVHKRFNQVVLIKRDAAASPFIVQVVNPVVIQDPKWPLLL